MGLSRFLGNSTELAELVANLIRVGEVTSINPAAGTARVRFEDRDNVESYDLRVTVRRSLKNKDYDMPDVGENVLCLFLPSGVEAGFIVASYYPNPVPRPESDPDVTARVFEDGTRIEYNRATNALLIDASASSGAVNVVCGNANVQASEQIALTAPVIALNGAVEVVGPSLTHNGVNVGDTHAHPINSGSSAPGPTGGPQ